MTFPSSDRARRAAVVGTGLIGGSIGLALRQRGWQVAGVDHSEARAARALELGALDVVGPDPQAEVTFIATPVGAVAAEASRALVTTGAHGGIVTDVAGVKAPIVAAVNHPRFVGGHPMAGSEQEGIDGADSTLFDGATWVLTPTELTDARAYAGLLGVVSSLGADVLAMDARRHDDLVAMVSHVPHLTAAALMSLAADASEEHTALLRLAAGGFRDMTRIAAGHPGIWPDICVENRVGIVDALDRLLESIGHLRALVTGQDREGILKLLERARSARTNLPARVRRPEDLIELRIPVPDRPGVLAEVTTLLGELNVNVYDLEIAHSVEGDRGVLVVAIDGTLAERVTSALARRSYRTSTRRLG